MTDTSVKRYVPVIKGKLGEFRAIGELADDIKDAITPLIEVPSIPWDFENDEPAKTLEKHLLKFVPNLKKYWGGGRLAFVDLNFIPPDQRIDGEHPLKRIFDSVRAEGLSLIPVVGLERDADYIKIAKDILQQDGQGVCIRIETTEIDEENMEDSLTPLIKKIGVSETEVDLVIDLKVIQKNQVGLLTRSVRDVIRSLPKIKEWRSIALVATAFPQSMSLFEPNSIKLTSRVEWQLWTNILHNAAKIIRVPDFGDYTIVHPELLDIDPRIMQLGAKIKYTVDNDWIIVKGTSIKRGGSAQTVELCRKLITHRQFCGPDFSWGDRYIQGCANGTESFGNQTTWVQVGVNHHIAYVVKQLQMYSAS